MGLIRGGLIFVVSSLIMFSLLTGNIFLTLSLSLENNDLRSELFFNTIEVDGEEFNLTKEVEDNFYLLEEDCETSENVIFEYEGYAVDISCDVVDQGPQAVLDKSLDDAIEIAIEENYPNSSFAKKLPDLLLSENSSDYWMNYFYVTLIFSLVLIGLLFFLMEDRINLPISVGSLLIISALPFFVLNFLSPLFENSLLKPLTLLFSESYTVFLIFLTMGVILMILGFGLKFFKIGWSLSEKFGKIKNLFTKKSNISQEGKK